MEVKAIAKFVGISKKKAQVIANITRGKGAVEASNMLKYVQKGAALPVKKVIDSAIANAKNNNQMNVNTLYICDVRIDQGPSQRRIIYKGKGGYSFFVRPTSHITVVLKDESERMNNKSSKVKGQKPKVEAKEVVSAEETKTKKVATKPKAKVSKTKTKAAKKD